MTLINVRQEFQKNDHLKCRKDLHVLIAKIILLGLKVEVKFMETKVCVSIQQIMMLKDVLKLFVKMKKQKLKSEI